MPAILTILAALYALYRLVVRGQLTLDTGVGRSTRPLGPVSWALAAPPETVFDVLAGPYIRTPRAMSDKLEVWERSSEMVLAAHHTKLPRGVATTLETVRFERPHRIDFRLVRGPVPHVAESFLLRESGGGTELTWEGELGTDLWALGRLWGDRVAAVWEATVRESVENAKTEAERRSS